MNIKSLLPFDNYTLVTFVKVPEVMGRLEANVSPKKLSSMLVVKRYGQKRDPSEKPYAGNITGQQFEIVRVINYKNSFLPVVKGEVSHFLGQTEIRVKSSPHIAVLVFSACWMLMVLLGCLIVTVTAINDGFEPALLIPFAMLIFGSLLFTVPYKIEAKKAKEFLAKLLEATEVKAS
jgi:hypothetical protein